MMMNFWERVSPMIAMAVVVVTVCGALIAYHERRGRGVVLTLFAMGIVGFLLVSRLVEVIDWVLGALDSSWKHAADSHPQSDDGPGFWLPLTVAAAGLAVSCGGYGLSLIQRRRARKAAQRAADTAAQERRRAVEAEHDEVLDAYAAYLCDVLAVLDRPALDDVTVPQTVFLLHALDAAADARRGGGLDLYRPAVSQLTTAWRAADEHARKTGLSHLPSQERATVTRARGLLEIALDGNGGEHERRAAYAKARVLLDGVLVLPREAVAAVETRTRPALVKGATD
ncbi:hypothetical protein [Streptomyces sp. NPDC087294]|uniref:hypothetical protein n=1 Tax=Streptomyces sp. NPDC087294 TaxID=3365777 RepID=UPI00380B66E9